MTFEFTAADHAPRHTDIIGTEGFIDRTAITALLETESFIASLSYPTTRRAFVDLTITVIVDVIARFRRECATCTATVADIFIHDTIAVIVT